MSELNGVEAMANPYRASKQPQEPKVIAIAATKTKTVSWELQVALLAALYAVAQWILF